MSKPINIGIIGCANIAKRSMIPALFELPELYIVTGIASRAIETAEQTARKWNIKALAGYDSLLDQNGLEAVYIPLPNALHATWIEKALNKNIHVLCEKSLSCSQFEVENLNNIAAENNLVLMENFQFRFHRQFARISEIIKSGELGELRSIRSVFGFPPFPDSDNIRYQKKLGGGALFDAGAYPIKVSQMILGNDLEVTAASLFYDPEKGVDIWGGGFIQHKHSALFSEIAFGFDNCYQCSLDIWGSRGRLVTNRIFTAPPGFEAEIIIETANGKRVENIPADNHFKNMLVHFCELICGKKDPKEEYQQNISQARLIAEFHKKTHE